MRPASALAWTAAGVLATGLLAAPLVVDAATSAVSIKNFAFAPQIVTVNLGDTVRWTNNEGSAIFHTATADNGAFNSGVLGDGQSFSFVATAAGEITYHCNVHPSMRGSVMVIGPATPPPPPPPTAPPPPPPTSAPPTPAPRTPAPPPATPAPTTPATAAPTATPSPSPSPTPTATASPSPAATPSPTAVAAASPSAPTTDGAAPGGPIAVALAVVAVGALGWWLLRRRSRALT